MLNPMARCRLIIYSDISLAAPHCIFQIVQFFRVDGGCITLIAKLTGEWIDEVSFNQSINCFVGDNPLLAGY
jgi:hypothetical protein